jgi:hypothetical protein
MATPKLEVYQLMLDKDTYLVHRYKDDKNKNYEYQIYKLAEGKSVAKEFGISDSLPNRKFKLSTREMSDKLIQKVKKEGFKINKLNKW